ncbi:YihY/virulence factor BrkB family protein [uncultured Roseovarius sp.]|uniref:YihY/virulence factor BrkB family protein n=1 Tax=uncultured Roseovarius sp. TaxID=293344 RepID=UPI0026054EF4|nr:YihY/virulence factor BrkB family protein [uncultured Roseovarius sp.]
MSRGRQATSPTKIPQAGWIDILWRVKSRVSDDRISLLAAGIAFYALLALFPAIAALLAIGGLVMDPPQIIEQMTRFAGVVPSDVISIIEDQATAVTGSSDTGLGLTLVVSVALALWSSSRGMASLVQGLNIVYEEHEKRGYFILNIQILILTLLLILGFLIGIAAIVVLPAVLHYVTLGNVGEILIGVLRWVLLIAMTMFGLAIIFRYGPSRSNAKWRWVSPGAVLGCLFWIIASVAFTFYVTRFSTYNESFGAIGGVIVLTLWLWISAFVIMLGAELNAEIEAQTKKDSTAGPPEPMGKRGAFKADNLGKSCSGDSG